MATIPLDELAQRPVADVRSVGSILTSNAKFLVGSTIFVGLLILAIGVGQLLGPGVLRTGAFPPTRPPAFPPAPMLLGTTDLGQSILAQLTMSIPNSMLVGLVAATIGTVVGALLGLLSGYFGGKLDAILRVLIDVFLAVPSLMFLILIAAVLRGLNVATIALIIGAFAWSWPARAVRSQVLSLKERPFVQVGLLSGLSGVEIVWGELMPHLLPWLGANFINAFIAAMLAESGLSILGLGSQRDFTLGQMIYFALRSQAVLNNLWWWWVTPVLMLIVLFLSLYLIHLGLDEVTNPRLRSES